MARGKRGTLSPCIPTPALMTALTDAALVARRGGQHLLTPEALLLALIRDPQGSVHRVSLIV